MLKLIKNIQGELLTSKVGSVNMHNGISAIIQMEDYINVYGFEAFLQNYTKVEEPREFLEIPLNFGLPNEYKLDVQTIEIDY
jgi:hypothetical protein